MLSMMTGSAKLNYKDRIFVKRQLRFVVSLIFRLIFGLTLLPMEVAAEDVRLSIDSDLVIHPEDVSVVMQRAVSELNQKSLFSFEAITFAKPVRTHIKNLMTASPILMALETADVKNLSIGFSASWENPAISVGELVIDDNIYREENGVRLIIHLKGRCENLTVVMPKANWQIRGALKWKWVGSQAIFDISSFDLVAQPAEVELNMGDCEISQNLKSELQRAINSVLANEAQMEEIFKNGLIQWLNGHFPDLETELMKERELKSAADLSVKWIPHSLQNADGTVLVKGRLELARSGFGAAGLVSIERDSAMLESHKVVGSGFVLPKASLPAITDFVYRSNLLSRRFSSKKVDSLKSLFSSRLIQFFYWPDLFNFKSSSEFWFDMYPSAAPKYLGAKSIQDGIAISVQAPLSIRQWAPVDDKYIPYVDFSSTGKGNVSLVVKNEKLELGFAPDDLSLKYQFAKEYLLTRNKVTQWIRISSFESNLEKYLNKKVWSLAIPKIPIPGRQELSLVGIHRVEQGVLLELDAFMVAPSSSVVGGGQ